MRGCTGPVFSCEKYCIFTAEEDPWVETSYIVWGFCYVIKALLAYCLVLYNVTMTLYSINYTCLSCGHGGCDLVKFCVFQFQTDWNDLSDLSWEVYYWIGKDSSVSGTTSP